MKFFSFFASALSVLCLASCSTYVTPAGPADLSGITQSTVKAAYQTRPAIKFPTSVAVVRVQDLTYRSYRGRDIGSGVYGVVLGADPEAERRIEALTQLPGLEGVVRLNRLLVPKELTSDEPLRVAAAKLHADAILLYTVSTEFSNRDVIAPLTTLSLGMAPNKRYKIHSTASGLLMDTKTGYLYGALENSKARSGFTMAWGGRAAIDNAKEKAEREAIAQMLTSFEPLWKRVYARHK